MPQFTKLLTMLKVLEMLLGLLLKLVEFLTIINLLENRSTLAFNHFKNNVISFRK